MKKHRFSRYQVRQLKKLGFKQQFERCCSKKDTSIWIENNSYKMYFYGCKDWGRTFTDTREYGNFKQVYNLLRRLSCRH